MSTIKDVARIAEVSLATVSRVVNNGPKVGQKTREKVLKVMADIGYTPNANARALVTKKNMTIGVVLPDLTEPFFASLAHGVEQIARDKKMQLLLSTSLVDAQSERQAINLLRERRCDVMVVQSKKLTDEELIQLAAQISGLVIINRYIEPLANRCIWLDNLQGGRLAAQHLLSLNHQHIACISSRVDIDDPQQRLSGFTQELATKGCTINPELIVSTAPTLQGGELAAQQLLAKRIPFSAVFVYNDAMAIGAISTLEDNGYRVPQDISVIGFDDVLLARYARPKLTTLNYPIEKMAKRAALLALTLAEDACASTNDLKYIPTLVARESTQSLNKIRK